MRKISSGKIIASIISFSGFFLVTILKLKYISRLSMNFVASSRTVKSWLKTTICGRSPTASVVRYDYTGSAGYLI